ncbi:MAG: dihydrofolate reductase [Candidatus Aenigmarchaeota archaeon]|nr:dihydrofolate reductase [Candidatus Aenigmarchaeota archaeon]
MKVLLLMAMSANGMIARENGEEDFLSHENWKTFLKLLRKHDCLIYGRKTYDAVKSWDAKYMKSLASSKKIIVSKNAQIKFGDECIIASSPEDALLKAKENGFNKLLLSGGSLTNSAFMKAGLIDEIIFNIEPYVLGKGISVFAENAFEAKLRLVKTRKLKSGIFQIHYDVRKN